MKNEKRKSKRISNGNGSGNNNRTIEHRRRRLSATFISQNCVLDLCDISSLLLPTIFSLIFARCSRGRLCQSFQSCFASAYVDMHCGSETLAANTLFASIPYLYPFQFHYISVVVHFFFFCFFARRSVLNCRMYCCLLLLRS